VLPLKYINFISVRSNNEVIEHIITGLLRMINEIDTRLGRVFGLSGAYADLPVFQIVNDTHDFAAAFTSRIIALEQGGDGNFYRSAPQWQSVTAIQADFRNRINNLKADALKAAALSEDILNFSKRVLDPLVDTREKSTRVWNGRMGGRVP
jgi:hypothetical protein